MALILAECRRLNADSSFLPRGHQRVVHREADREAQEPGVVIEHPQRGIDETDEGHRAARRQRANRVPVDPAGEFVEASAAVEVFHQDDFFAQHEVVADQHAGDGAEKARVAHQPAKNVATIVGWLVGYSGFLGPIAGVLICDYFVLRKKLLIVEDLYQRNGQYEYSRGFNWTAVAALAAGAAVAFVGLAYSPLRVLYNYAWFVGFLVSFLIYFALMNRVAPVTQPAD